VSASLPPNVPPNAPPPAPPPDLPPDAVRKSQLVPGASPGELYAIVTDFAAYPRLFKEIKSARVLAGEGPRQRVEFRAEAVVAVRYVPEAGGTRMDYATKVTIKAPLPGFVIRRVTDALVSVSLPAMFAAITAEHAARRRSGSPR
jgi:hypothetical protein